ncbi:zinc ABC transporter substrate-binding protein [Bacterioplanes sanyensis]|uniref:metal ABC transporter solute-binding protein, Zn/Mn family n=1 Tax=Bacterioplanes sanyensis TaxID=1249553 RepID=UPI0016761EE6|nr:zinc ABC transporter substrate-binding protein [Bacterioplanes sanyensis]GGY49417.1 zinc ABC transporter substrate-binding protein [Bacterioplanes sanyensis]
MIKAALFAIGVLFTSLTFAQQQPKVLASVHPLALVAASVVATDDLHTLVPGHLSPHDFALRPSDIDRLQQADVIIWSGPQAEPYLRGFVARWPDKIWLNAADYAPEGASDDPHWWLSPTTMRALQAQLAQHLERSPEPFQQQLQQALEDSKALLAPVRERGFYVFHRAYDHWVEALQLNQLGSLTLSPEHKPGLRTLSKIRSQLQQGKAHCVFSEPQYDPALIDSLTQGLNINRAELDPMAAAIVPTADAYPNYLRQLAQAAAECLGPLQP